MDSKMNPPTKKRQQSKSNPGSKAKKFKRDSNETKENAPTENNNGGEKASSSTGAKTAKQRKDHTPNQTVKASFTKANRMPPYANDWGKNVLSLYCKYCMEQESYNLMVVRNLATMLANFIFFKEYIEEKPEDKASLVEEDSAPKSKKAKLDKKEEAKGQDEEETKIKPSFNQSFYYGCLSSFNCNGYGEKIPGKGMRVGCDLKALREHVLSFANIGCPNNFNLTRVFDDTTSIAANQLAVNADEYFKRKTKVLLKLLVQHCNPSTSKRSANTVAKLLMMQDFYLDKKRIPLRYAMKKKLSDPYEKTVDFANYKVQQSELNRWLFFHKLLLICNEDYKTRCTEQKQWTPIAKANKRPHVDMNETQWTKMFPKKLSNILKCLSKREDPFLIFRCPGFPGSPLAKLFPVVKKRRGVKPFDKLTQEEVRSINSRLEKKQYTLWKKINEINTILKDQNAFENYVSLLQSRNIQNQARPTPAPQIHLPLDQKDFGWEFLLPSLHRVIKGNVFKRFRKFRHISTNGVDMSIYIINEHKQHQNKTKPTNLTMASIKNKRIIGVDPGVHSLATSTYSNHLDKSDISQQGRRHQFYFKTTQGRIETQISSKEIRHKADIACGPLAQFRRYHTATIKKRLMAIPAQDTLTMIPSTSHASTPSFAVSPSTPKSFFSTYPNHKSDAKGVLEFTELNNKYLLESSKILSSNYNLYWSWFSYRYTQIQYSSIPKRIISPAFAETLQELKSLRKHTQVVVKKSKRSHFKKHRKGQNSAPRKAPKNGKKCRKKTSMSYIKRHPHIKSTVKKHLRKPWLPDSILFKLIQRHAKIRLTDNPIIIAFGNGSRQVGFIRGHRKGSAEKVFNSLVHLLGSQNVIDASEYRTTMECHFCGSEVTDNHWINDQIQEEPRATLFGHRLHRRLKAAQLSPPSAKPYFWFGRKRSSFEMRKCNFCNRIFNRDANAAINILNLFIHQVHQNSNRQ